MSQSGLPAAASTMMSGPGLSAGASNLHGSPQKGDCHFEHPLFGRETPSDFTFEMSDVFTTPLVIVCPITRTGPVKSRPIALAAPVEVRAKLQKFTEFYEGTSKAVGLSHYPLMPSHYHETGQSIVDALPKVTMSDEAKRYLWDGPCGIRKHAYLFEQMLSHPTQFNCDVGTAVDAPMAPWNELTYREYVMNESGYCMNLNGGVYHQAYGVA